MSQCVQFINNIKFTFPILMYIVLSEKTKINSSNYMTLIFQDKMLYEILFFSICHYLLNKLHYEQHQSSLHLAS
jgi:hypothetical protein